MAKQEITVRDKRTERVHGLVVPARFTESQIREHLAKTSPQLEYVKGGAPEVVAEPVVVGTIVQGKPAEPVVKPRGKAMVDEAPPADPK